MVSDVGWMLKRKRAGGTAAQRAYILVKHFGLRLVVAESRIKHVLVDFGLQEDVFVKRELIVDRRRDIHRKWGVGLIHGIVGSI